MKETSGIRHGYRFLVAALALLAGAFLAASAHASGSYGSLDQEDFTDQEIKEMQGELRDAFRLYDKEGRGYIVNPLLQKTLDELDGDLSLSGLDLN